MNKIKFRTATLFVFAALLSVLSCKPPIDSPTPLQNNIQLVPSPQRTGSAERGYEYLVTGDYLKSGVPIDIWYQVMGERTQNLLNRTGLNAGIDYNYNLVLGKHNTEVVVPNCLSCHASYIQNKLVIGLGNTSLNFSNDQSIDLQILNNLVLSQHGSSSLEFQDFKEYKQTLEAIAPLSKTNTQGVNPADKYALILANHRNKASLKWQSLGSLSIDNIVIPTDVPAWWLLKKKFAMFYTGVGTGDFARLMMASSLFSLTDTLDARKIDNEFANVYAFIKTLRPPKYFESIDDASARRGRVLFDNNCQQCHGTYDNVPTYPNLIVPLETIKTDPELLKANFSSAQLLEWYNSSWFARPPYTAKLVIQQGYVAPPLDGIWATAPYLHNGSIPTLQDLLNSNERPRIWKRNFTTQEYDTGKVGWKYARLNNKIDKQSYDTNEKGYSNQGHNFGDGLSVEQRADLIEYLKTL